MDVLRPRSIALRNQYDGIKAEEARRLKEFELKHTWLKRVVAGLTADNHILKEANEFLRNGSPARRRRLVTDVRAATGSPSVVPASCSAKPDQRSDTRHYDSSVKSRSRSGSTNWCGPILIGDNG